MGRNDIPKHIIALGSHNRLLTIFAYNHALGSAHANKMFMIWKVSRPQI